MKNKLLFSGLFIIILVSSCAIFKPFDKEQVTDPVCGMKVVKGDAYTRKYEGKIYYFESYNCKQLFIMTPEKYVK
jgi:YHS domain-containing protein